MIRLIFITLLSMSLIACGGSDDDPAPAIQGGNSFQTTSFDGNPVNVNPTTMGLARPPTDGRLPESLLPPIM